MIWKAAANLPRNLDIWARPTGTTSYRNDDLEWEEFKTFRYTTRQPVPGVLLATKESRAASREFFHMNFGENIDWGGGFKIDMNCEIMRNFEADRLCPMGPFTEYASSYFWGALPPPSCAVNLYRASTDEPDPLEKLMFYADGFHDEILFYYCEKLIPINGPFDFIELSEEQAFYREWKTFLEAKERLQQQFDYWVERRRDDIKRKHERMDLGPPTEDDLNLGWICPHFKCVALIVNGVRRR
jgi:hypothetical protein